ncbi:MAG: M6 family metalloprotease domain-containing protein [Candidatus Wallbacteria bacterium]|nr:M6 family metalloprotease domain-containing protein [Candidatus Wallbacteria bacterium]
MRFLLILFLLEFSVLIFADILPAPPKPDVYPEFYHSELSSRRAPLRIPDHAPKMGAFTSQDPQTGECVILVVPFGFTDKPMTDTINQDLNQKETRFVAYYEAVSHGKLQVTFVNAPIVTSSHTYDWYAADSVSNTDDYNGNIYELAREAIDKLKAQSYSFNQSLLDKNNDGILDHLMVVHSGNAQEATRNAGDIWSNRWEIQNPSGPHGEIISTGFKAQNYTMQAQSSPVGILCHEFGHDLGLPDLYDTANGNSVVGRWCLMDGGSWNGISTNDGSSPAYLSAWCRYFLGWCDLTDISAYAGNFSLTPIESTTDPVIRAAINGTEYFLLENRQLTGFDSGIPGSGALVWHVDEQILTTQWESGINNNSSHYGVSVVEADWTSGSHLGMGGDEGTAADAFPGSLNKTVFNTTLPSSGANSSSFYALTSYVSLSSIQTSGSSINFTNNYSGPKAIARITLNPASASVNAGASYSLGLVTVTARYSDTTTASVTGTWSIKSGSGRLSGSTYTAAATTETALLTCSYKEAASGYTKTADFSIAAAQGKQLSSITLNPASVTIELSCNLSSIEVTAHYSDSSTAKVTSVSWTKKSDGNAVTGGAYTPSSPGTSMLVCSYTESSLTKTAELTVVALKHLTAVTLSATQITVETATFDLGGITVNAHYTDSSTAAVTGTWTRKSGDGSVNGAVYTAPQLGGSAVLLCSYSEGSFTATAELSLTALSSLVPVSMQLTPAELTLNEYTEYSLKNILAVAGFSNGSTAEIIPTWSILTGTGTLESGIFTAPAWSGETTLCAAFNGHDASVTAELAVSTVFTGGIMSRQFSIRNGWNLISLGLTPCRASIEVIFDQTAQMKYVMAFFRNPPDQGNEGFRTYMNIEGLRDFSTLITLDGYHGYWVYATSDCSLTADGTAISETVELQLGTGWNLIGYWLSASNSLPTVELQTNTVIDCVFNQNPISGKSRYIMGFYRDTADGGNEGFRTFMNNSALTFSTLKNLDPLMGYWFYMENAGKLNYGYRAP